VGHAGWFFRVGCASLATRPRRRAGRIHDLTP
jgi:hypothetical protein